MKALIFTTLILTLFSCGRMRPQRALETGAVVKRHIDSDKTESNKNGNDGITISSSSEGDSDLDSPSSGQISNRDFLADFDLLNQGDNSHSEGAVEEAAQDGSEEEQTGDDTGEAASGGDETEVVVEEPATGGDETEVLDEGPEPAMEQQPDPSESGEVVDGSIDEGSEGESSQNNQGRTARNYGNPNLIPDSKDLIPDSQDLRGFSLIEGAADDDNDDEEKGFSITPEIDSDELESYSSGDRIEDIQDGDYILVDNDDVICRAFGSGASAEFSCLPVNENIAFNDSILGEARACTHDGKIFLEGDIRIELSSRGIPITYVCRSGLWLLATE